MCKCNFTNQNGILGMVFQVSIGFSDLVNAEAKDEESKKYALFIGDTIQVNKEDAATVFTVPKKKMENIGIFIKVSAQIREILIYFHTFK